MAKHLLWDITYKCNLKCRHCYNMARLYNKDIPIINSYSLEAIINQIKFLGIEHVHILGGEPLCVKELPKLIDLLYNAGISISINTNATLLNKELNYLLLSKIDQITISLDGMKTENDEIRGKGIFDIVVKKLEELKFCKEEQGSKTKIHMAIVANSKNISTLYQIPTMALRFGINSIMLMRLYECEDANIDYSNLKITPKQYVEMLPRFLLSCYQSGIKVQIDSKPKVLEAITKKTGIKIDTQSIYNSCQAGKSFIYMDAYGNIYPCSPLSHNSNIIRYNIFKLSCKEIECGIEKTVKKSQAMESFSICENCVYKMNCKPCGICNESDIEICEFVDEF